MSIFTVLGSTGFIGSNLVSYLKSLGEEVATPARNAAFDSSQNLGHVIYCIGLTADFRKYPLDTAEAHVSRLVEFLKVAKFESFLYLSSTRVYEGSNQAVEAQSLTVDPAKPEHIFNLTKLAGEAICMSQDNPAVRIARVSNVLGEDFTSENFIFSVMKDAAEKKSVEFRTTAETAKDYIWIDDVVSLLHKIAVDGKKRMYNVASGASLSNAAIAALITKISGAQTIFAANATKVSFPNINVQRISEDFQFKPTDVIPKLSALYTAYSIFLKNSKNA